MTYTKIPQTEYATLVSEFKRNVGKTLLVFNCYGMGEYLPEVTGVIVTLAEQLAMAIRGKDVKIHTHYNKERPTA